MAGIGIVRYRKIIIVSTSRNCLSAAVPHFGNLQRRVDVVAARDKLASSRRKETSVKPSFDAGTTP